MSSVPMPRDLSEEAVAGWLHAVCARDVEGLPWPQVLARAVRALVEATGEKVAKQAYRAGYSACGAGLDVTTRIDADVYFIVSRVLGEEAPRG